MKKRALKGYHFFLKYPQVAIMKNIRLLIAFDGTGFNGWQLQPDAPTIQGEIERHLTTIHNKKILVHGAGRTDAGVHAKGMVAHFHTEKDITAHAFQKALNSMLPDAIRILEAKEVDASFHSRFSAKAKTYHYSIFNGEIILPQDRLYSLHVLPKLDITCMQQCLDLIIGTHDFGCFETAGSRDLSVPCERGSIRTIFNTSITNNRTDFYIVAVTGDGFLRHMVRNIVGTIIEVGLGRRSLKSFDAALFSKKRSEAGSTAPAHGLTLEEIFY